MSTARARRGMASHMCRCFTYCNGSKKETRAQSGQNQAQGKTVLTHIHARFARTVSHAILYRSTFSSGLLVLATSLQSTGVVQSRYAAQHRVATDAPVGAFKIEPILRERSCHLSNSFPPGPRLNAIRWAAVACKQFLCGWNSPICVFVGRVGPSFRASPRAA